MDKIANFRDLGGIVTRDGTHVKHNCFIRCAMLEEATANDVAALKAMGIKMVFDYRSPAEYGLKTDYPYAEIGASRLKFPMLKAEDKLYQIQSKPNIVRAFSKVTLSDLQNTYRILPFDNDGYKAMVKAMTDGNVPFIQHCSAGKDRTGIGSALILALLNVSQEEILKDYLLSKQAYDYIASKTTEHFPKFMEKWLLKKYGLLFTVDESELLATFDEIDKRCGSFENFAKQEFGLNHSDLLDLRARYTE